MKSESSLSGEEVIVGTGTSHAAVPTPEESRAIERAACLILISERSEERVFPLRGSRWTIGRRHDRDVRIADPCVSSAHAEIIRRGPNFFLRDVGSTNGTLVNGAPIHERRLQPNDRIDLAGVATILFTTPGPGGFPPPDETSEDMGPAAAVVAVIGDMTRTHRLVPATPAEAAQAARDRQAALADAAETATREPEGGESADDRRISILYQLAEALGTTRSEAGIFERTLDITLSLVPADRAMIFLGERMRAGEDEPVPVAKRLRGGGASAGAPASRTIIAEVMREGRAIGTADALFDPRFAGSESARAGRARAVMAAPIATKNGIMGVLYLDSTAPGYFFSRAELMLVWAIAFQAALALENARFVRELERRMAVIEELAHVRGRLFSFATHDLKAPLASLLGSISGLVPRVESEPSSAWVGPELTTAAGTLRRLVDLLDDLLLRQRGSSAAAASAVGASGDSVDLERLVRETAEDHTRWTDAGRVQLELRVCGPLPRVRVDRRRASCVLSNLVLHSMRRSPEGGRIVLEAARAGQDRVEIAVRDQGPMPPPAPAGSALLEDGGASGLAIIRELVAMLGGELEVRALGDGVRFSFLLPAPRRGEGCEGGGEVLSAGGGGASS